MTDLTARAERVLAVVAALHGKVLSCIDDVMRVEVPAVGAGHPGTAKLAEYGGK